MSKKVYFALVAGIILFTGLGFYLGALDNAPFPLWPGHYQK